MRTPTITPTSSTHPHHLSTPLSTSVSNGTPKTRNPGLRDPTTAVTVSSPPHHLRPSPTTTISDSMPQT
ncbi:hypothetical protein PILCRDRAFT_815740, partial [Piloderma croceum F 1598]